MEENTDGYLKIYHRISALCSSAQKQDRVAYGVGVTGRILMETCLRYVGKGVVCEAEDLYI